MDLFGTTDVVACRRRRRDDGRIVELHHVDPVRLARAVIARMELPISAKASLQIHKYC
jgi:hypothetical protein